jgi:serine protease Do
MAPAAAALAADPRLAAELGDVAAALRRVTVQIRSGPGSHGSGVIWSPDGLLVTNAHVVAAPEAMVELWDGRTLAARVTRRDPARDLAALRAPAGGLPVAEPGDVRELRPGALVLALGHPFGTPALSLGVLHAGSEAGGSRPRWIRADVRLAPGNSGGPLADVRGRVLGLNAMIVGGLGFAVPSTAVARFLRGDRTRASLGVVARPVPLGARGGGVGFVVLDVAPGSAAQSAGLAQGDVLVGAGGRRFRSPDALAALMEDAEPGDRLALLVVRGFERFTREVMLGGGPEVDRAA